MEHVMIENISVRYQDGQKHPILCIHGFCEDSSMWDSLVETLPGHPILCPDLPGFGKSPPAPGSTIEQMANKIQTVIHHFGWQKTVCLGHSMGGYVGLALAEQDGELLSGLGLIHSHPFADSPEKKLARLKAIQFLEQNGVPAFVRQLIPTLFAPEFARRNPLLLQPLINQASKYPLEGVKSALLAMRDRPSRVSVLAQLDTPVLFLNGTEDAAIPRKYCRKQTLIPPVSEVVWLKGIGHMSLSESPARAIAAIKRFIALCTHPVGLL